MHIGIYDAAYERHVRTASHAHTKSCVIFTIFIQSNEKNQIETHFIKKYIYIR